jgi:hypothetical protein
MRLAHFDCASGVSGDMMLGALVDAGFDPAELVALPARLGLEGVTVTVGEAKRGAFRARRALVAAPGAQPHRHLKDVRALLERADLPAAARAGAIAVFERLAAAEAEVHGSTPEQVHFHEVGAADALVDIAGACLGRERLGLEAVYAPGIAVGSGTVCTEHGVLPVPAPATALLLRGATIDAAPLAGERATPTGAALLATWVRDWGAPPPYRLVAQGVGAGGRDPDDRPNVLRVFIGESAGPATRREVAVLETALDDAAPEVTAHAAALLLEQGARDVFVTPIGMKKGRPGVLVTVLCDPADVDRMSALLFRETPTIGLRVRREERRELARESAVVRVGGAEVALKVVVLPDGTRRAKPEYESLAALARATGRPLDALAAEALAAFAALARPERPSA